MKKLSLLIFAFCVAIACSAQLRTYSVNDCNQDGNVNVGDVNSVINKISGTVSSSKVVSADSLASLLLSIDSRLAAIKKKLGKSDDPVTPEPEPTPTPTPTSSNLLPGKFSVSATKQVQFTKSNLYWDGSAFKFEENQTDYLNSWYASHVSYFYWTNLTDYKSGNDFYMPYAQSYSCNYSSLSKSDKFWCGEDNPLTVEGTDGLYALTGSGRGEWYYLIYKRTNASSLYKYGVTVTNGGTSYTNCLIIAPDDYAGTLQSSYTLDEVNAAGLVCLPAAGVRYGSSFGSYGGYGYYWSATPYSGDSSNAYGLYFYSSYIYPAGDYYRRYEGRSLRIVRGL